MTQGCAKGRLPHKVELEVDGGLAGMLDELNARVKWVGETK